MRTLAYLLGAVVGAGDFFLGCRRCMARDIGTTPWYAGPGCCMSASRVEWRKNYGRQ